MDALWFHLYAILPRETTSDNLHVIRDPGLECLFRGPPAGLAARLRTLNACAEECRREAQKLARTPGPARFLHD